MAALSVDGEFEDTAAVADGAVVGRERRVNQEGEVDIGIGEVASGTLTTQDPVAGHVSLERVANGGGFVPGLLGVDEGRGAGAVIGEAPYAIEGENPTAVSEARTRRHKRVRAGSIGR